MQSIHTLAQPFKLSKPTAALQRQLNERIERFNAELEEHAAAIAKLQNADPEQLPLLTAEAEQLEARARELLIAEARLRRELVPYFAAALHDLRVAIDRAYADHLAVRADVSEKLVQAGFLLIDWPGADAPIIHPQVMALHPQVKQAWVELQTLQGTRMELERYNRERLAQIDQELRRLRSRAVAVAAL